MIERVRAGKYHRFRLKTNPLAEVRQVLETMTAFWIQRLDSLEEFLDAEAATKKPKNHERVISVP
jgi:hypothetical protein